MSRNPLSASKEFVLVAWQDSDVPDLIKDKSYAGKLNKENLGENNKTETLKKKRVSKKFTPLLNHDQNEDLSVLGLSNISTLNNDASNFKLSKNDHNRDLTKLSQHFVFGNQSSADSLMTKTSNNKLDQSLRITYSEMYETLKTYKPDYEEAIVHLNKSFETKLFPEWLKMMRFGFNILLHGIGSKKSLLQKFCETHLLNNYFYLELYGYHHDFNHKNLLKTILSDVLDLNEAFKTIDEQLNAINQYLNHPLYLVIHNIDGNCLRDTSIQHCLAELASNKNIHIIASVDHINSSLLWDQMQYVAFKWVHFETNTLVPYNDEIMFENSLMLNQTGNIQLSSMIHILKSLTQNAKNIFLIMVQYVLNPDNVKKSITFSKLYHECRERFYVSNELTLRAQLTEFIDHKLIKIKAESDGYETIFLLVDEANLKYYLNDIKDKV